MKIGGRCVGFSPRVCCPYVMSERNYIDYDQVYLISRHIHEGIQLSHRGRRSPSAPWILVSRYWQIGARCVSCIDTKPGKLKFVVVIHVTHRQ